EATHRDSIATYCHNPTLCRSIAAHPLVENGDHEVAVLRRFDRAFGDLIAFLKAGFIRALDNRNELDELGFDFIAQEAIDLKRVRSEEHTSELQSRVNIVRRLL